MLYSNLSGMLTGASKAMGDSQYVPANREEEDDEEEAEEHSEVSFSDIIEFLSV